MAACFKQICSKQALFFCNYAIQEVLITYFNTILFLNLKMKFCFGCSQFNILPSQVITVLNLKSWRRQLWIWRSQKQFYWRCEADPLQRIFATWHKVLYHHTMYVMDIYSFVRGAVKQLFKFFKTFISIGTIMISK
jgi:hypothetical protein